MNKCPFRTGLGQAIAHLLVLGVGTLVACCASAQIYVGVSASGGVVLTNHSSEQADTLLIGAAAENLQPPAPTSAPASATSPNPMPLRLGGAPAAPAALVPLIRAAARQHGLPERLLAAVVAVESGFDTRAVSRKGAQGLMQLMPDTARRFRVRNAFVAVDNLRGGAAYLSSLLRLFGDQLPLALAAYNAGEGAVLRAGRQVPAFAETQDYVGKVMALAGAEELWIRPNGSGYSP